MGTSSCTKTFDAGTSVTLTQHTNSGYRFGYWPNGGGITCSGDYTASTCTFTMDGDVSMTPLWEYLHITLKVAKTGTGSGTVTGSSSGINCGSTCSKSVVTADYPTLGSETFTAVPASDSTFDGWQTNGDGCFSGGGKIGSAYANTSTTCTFRYSSVSKTTQTVVPKFTKKASASSTPTSSTATSSSTSSSSASVAKPVAAKPNLQLATNSGLTLWQGTAFGVSGKTLGDTKSATTQVGLANKNEQPIALATVDLETTRDWSKAKLSYATDVTAHKAFMHGLTSAPGVVGGTFTLYVPYGVDDEYVGICPGASSLSALGTTCPNLYYLSDGQSKTHKDDSGIPSGVTVKAKIATINKVKYWSVSGLSGTGGFSSTTAVVPSASPAATTQTDTPKGGSRAGLYVAGSIVAVLLLGLGGTYKLWLPKLKNRSSRY